MKRLAVVLIAVAALGAACGRHHGPPCIRSHTDLVWMPMTQYNPATKTMTTTYLWYPQTTCDAYGPKPSGEGER